MTQMQEAQSPGVWLSQTNCQMGQSGHAAAKGSRGRFTGMAKKGGRTHENALNRRTHGPEANGSQDTDARGWLVGLSSLLCIYHGHIQKQNGSQDWGHKPAILTSESSLGYTARPRLKNKSRLGVVVYAFSPGTWKARAGLYGKLQASQGSTVRQSLQ